MPQSLSVLYAHLIFSTQNRKRWLDETIRERIHPYLAGIARDMGCPFVVVGGIDDHVHILLQQPKQHTTPKLVEDIKRRSSKWIKTQGDEYRDFCWQRGYAIFSVGPLRVPAVEAYVRTQPDHHKRMTFQDEYRKFLRKYEVDTNEQYAWD